MLKEKFGFETIFYEENESNTGLENFVFEMEKEMNFDGITEQTVEAMVPKHEQEDDEALTQKLINESKKR